MQVEEVDVGCLQAGEGVGGALAEGFERVADGVGADGGVGWGGEVAAVFRCEPFVLLVSVNIHLECMGDVHNLVPVTAGFHPFSNPLLGLAVLVVIRAIS